MLGCGPSGSVKARLFSTAKPDGWTGAAAGPGGGEASGFAFVFGFGGAKGSSTLYCGSGGSIGVRADMIELDAGVHSFSRKGAGERSRAGATELDREEAAELDFEEYVTLLDVLCLRPALGRIITSSVWLELFIGRRVTMGPLERDLECPDLLLAWLFPALLCAAADTSDVELDVEWG